MGIDEAGDDDPAGGVDHRGRIARDCDIGTDLPDLAVLDQHVGAREIADLPVDRQHQAALDQDPARALQAAELAIRAGRAGTLRQRRAGQSGGAGGQYPGARLEKAAARGCTARPCSGSFAVRRAVIKVIAHRKSPLCAELPFPGPRDLNTLG